MRTGGFQIQDPRSQNTFSAYWHFKKEVPDDVRRNRAVLPEFNHSTVRPSAVNNANHATNVSAP